MNQRTEEAPKSRQIQMSTISKQAYEYAPLLEKMIEILSANDKISIGDALKQAKLLTGISEIPERIESALLTITFKIISSGKIPGAPDA